MIPVMCSLMRIRINGTTIINGEVLEDCDYNLVVNALELRSFIAGYLNRHPDIDRIRVDR